MKVSCVFDNQVHHRICSFARLTSAALISIGNQRWVTSDAADAKRKSVVVQNNGFSKHIPEVARHDVERPSRAAS